MEVKKQDIFHAYRGTNKEWGQKWEKNKQLKFSNGKDEYFGHGFYFFENDYKEALNWAKNIRKIPKGNISIIYAYIKSDKVYDLIDRETYNEYVHLMEIISKRFKNCKEKPKINKPYDCNLINMIVKENNYDMVRGAYSPNHSKSLILSKDGYTRINKTHIQLCVINKEIIKGSEVEYL